MLDRSSLKPSQILHSDRFFMIRDGNFLSWISRFLVVTCIANKMMAKFGDEGRRLVHLKYGRR